VKITSKASQLVIQESRGTTPSVEAAAELLSQKAWEAGIERFVDAKELNRLTARVEFAGLELPDVRLVLWELCSGLRSFTELKSAAANFIRVMEQKIGKRQLSEIAPARIRLQNGHHIGVHYERGKVPWIASRLQDFFGVRESPRIGPEHKPIVIHLLAPNQQPVQMKTDLPGFWERLYPQVRRELMRRYPKHPWPERP
jgi:ATP-dependent helicase HrpB